VTLPSFQELLEVQKADKASNTTTALLTPTTPGNHTAPKNTTDITTTSSTISATASATVSNSSAASGPESGAPGVTVKMGVTGVLVAVGIGLGMFLI
jgi:hypothetical protein